MHLGLEQVVKWTDVTLNVSHMVVGATPVLSFSQAAADLLWIPTLAKSISKNKVVWRKMACWSQGSEVRMGSGTGW